MNGFEALIWRSILYIASPSWRCWTASRILPFGATCSSSSSSSSLSLSLSHWWLDVRGPLQLGQASSLLLCRGGELARLVACVLHLKFSGVAGEEDFCNLTPFVNPSCLCLGDSRFQRFKIRYRADKKWSNNSISFFLLTRKVLVSYMGSMTMTQPRFPPSLQTSFL